MKHLTFYIMLFTQLCSLNSLCQEKKESDQFGISVPLIWNDTKVLNVIRGARANYISGGALSYGMNLNYSKAIWKDFFVTGGLGYFNQNFGIPRNFDFNGDSVKILDATKRYAYNSINWIVGFGYRNDLSKNYSFRASALFNGLYSFRQKYVPTHLTSNAFKKYQAETRSYNFGRMLTLNAGAYRSIYKGLSVGIDVIFPVYTRWRKDRIFRENEAEFQSSRFILGSNFSFMYQLH